MPTVTFTGRDVAVARKVITTCGSMTRPLAAQTSGGGDGGGAAAGGGRGSTTRHKPEFLRKEVAKAAEVGQEAKQGMSARAVMW
jgi:hypothetical protein